MRLSCGTRGAARAQSDLSTFLWDLDASWPAEQLRVRARLVANGRTSFNNVKPVDFFALYKVRPPQRSRGARDTRRAAPAFPAREAALPQEVVARGGYAYGKHGNNWKAAIEKEPGNGSGETQDTRSAAFSWGFTVLQRMRNASGVGKLTAPSAHLRALYERFLLHYERAHPARAPASAPHTRIPAL